MIIASGGAGLRTRIFSAILAMAIVFQLSGPMARAAEQESVVYNGKTLMVVNDSFDGTKNGWFQVSGYSDMADITASVPFSGSGDTSCRMKTLNPIGKSEQTVSLMENPSASYQLLERKTLNMEEREFSRQMQCLYIGEYCTVWGSTDEDERIQLNQDQARQIGQDFDSHLAVMQEAFGDHWCDVDNDGKVALMCYNVDEDPLIEEDHLLYSSFRAGYFYMKDLIQKDGNLGEYYFGESSYLNGMDLLHVDTYPGMGNGNDYLSDLSASYSTIIHEFQHMINYTYTLESDDVGHVMEPFFDEALSMAAEHHVFGFDAVQNRVSFFNSDEYVSGSPLVAWDGSLSCYSNFHLFGQYVRTQYAQIEHQNGEAELDGHEVFVKILQERRTDSERNILSIIAELLQIEGAEPEKRLLNNFWKAVFLKEKAGPYGFEGEPWAYGIAPQLSAFTDENTVQPGGVKYYSLPDQGVTVTERVGVTVSVLDAESPLVPGTLRCKIDVDYPSPGLAALTMVLNQNAVFYYNYSDLATNDKSQMQPIGDAIPALTPFTLNLPMDEHGQDRYVSYYLKNEASETEIYHIRVSPTVQREEIDGVGIFEIEVLDSHSVSLKMTCEADGNVLAVAFDAVSGRMLELKWVDMQNTRCDLAFEKDLGECSVHLYLVNDLFLPLAEKIDIPTA